MIYYPLLTGILDELRDPNARLCLRERGFAIAQKMTATATAQRIVQAWERARGVNVAGKWALTAALSPIFHSS